MPLSRNYAASTVKFCDRHLFGVAIAWTQFYSRVHYPSDIVAG
ncbi:hypothetical protein [Trichocoleus sp. FACHB-262]|nr:hypothetical protein [Trichocoleus sp. FACHB-262]